MDRLLVTGHGDDAHLARVTDKVLVRHTGTKTVGLFPEWSNRPQDPRNTKNTTVSLMYLATSGSQVLVVTNKPSVNDMY